MDSRLRGNDGLVVAFPAAKRPRSGVAYRHYFDHLAKLRGAGITATPVQDRHYLRPIYSHKPPVISNQTNNQ